MCIAVLYLYYCFLCAWKGRGTRAYFLLPAGIKIIAVQLFRSTVMLRSTHALGYYYSIQYSSTATVLAVLGTVSGMV